MNALKILAILVCMLASKAIVVGQGLVNFLNNPTTLISARGDPIDSTPGSFYFGLFTAPLGTTDYNLFTFSGLYGTNQATAGRFSGGNNKPVAGWAPGTSRSFYVLGWSPAFGHDAQVALMYFDGRLAPRYYPIGHSLIGSGAAGGFDGTATLPSLNIFGLSTIGSGFNLDPLGPFPEPTSFALALIGTATLLICRRRKSLRSL